MITYQSDYDIYVLTRLAKHVDRFARNESLLRRFREIIPAPVSLIADTAKHFNVSLERGRYFYVDVMKEGVVLFDSGRIKLSEPRELSREEWLEEVAPRNGVAQERQCPFRAIVTGTRSGAFTDIVLSRVARTSSDQYRPKASMKLTTFRWSGQSTTSSSGQEQRKQSLTQVLWTARCSL